MGRKESNQTKNTRPNFEKGCSLKWKLLLLVVSLDVNTSQSLNRLLQYTLCMTSGNRIILEPVALHSAIFRPKISMWHASVSYS